MADWLKINLNNRIKFKPNEKGIEIYSQYHVKLVPYISKESATLHVDEEGYAVLPLWEFMQIYGNEMYMGNSPPFSMNVLIENGEWEWNDA